MQLILPTTAVHLPRHENLKTLLFSGTGGLFSGTGGLFSGTRGLMAYRALQWTITEENKENKVFINSQTFQGVVGSYAIPDKHSVDVRYM